MKKELRRVSDYYTIILPLTVSTNVIFSFVRVCGLSAKDRGAAENPVSDLELNFSKTATKAIEFY